MRKNLTMLLAGAALVTLSGVAAARTTVDFGINIGIPGPVYAPAYYPPPPVYSAPVYPVYAPPRVYYPAPVYYGPPAYYGPRYYGGYGRGGYGHGGGRGGGHGGGHGHRR
jgi:hypothetical protein